MEALLTLVLRIFLVCLSPCLADSDAHAQTTTQIGATFSTAPRYIQCVDYVCRDDTGEIVGTLEQVDPEELSEVEAGEEKQQKQEENGQ